MSFKDGQKLLYLTIKDEQPHAEVVIFKEGGTHSDQYDVISSKVYTKEQILEMFNEKSCVCPSSPPGVLLDDGTCGNCGGVVKPMSDFYKANMERHYGLRICPVCGHQNRHPNNHCDECNRYLEPISKWMKCPRCGGVTRKGNRCDSCDSGIPLCYGVVAPRTQDCANCIYTVECLEEQTRPVPPEEIPEIHPDILKAARGCGAAHYSTEDGQQYLVTFIGLKETAYEGPDISLEELPKECDPAGKDLSIPEPPIIHAEPDHTPPFKGKVMQDPTILCPNCKQPVGYKYEHSEDDYDGCDTSRWWECPNVGSEEKTP